MATDFPVNLQTAESGRDVLNFIRSYNPWPVKWKMYYKPIIYLDAARRAFTPAAAMSQVLALNTLFPNNTFPRNVDLRQGAKIRRIGDASGTGILSFTVQLGGTFDAGVDADGLVTASSIFTGEGPGYINTPLAANYADRYETEFSPTVTLTSTGANLDVSDLEGAFQVLVPWSPLERYD